MVRYFLHTSLIATVLQLTHNNEMEQAFFVMRECVLFPILYWEWKGSSLLSLSLVFYFFNSIILLFLFARVFRPTLLKSSFPSSENKERKGRKRRKHKSNHSKPCPNSRAERKRWERMGGGGKTSPTRFSGVTASSQTKRERERVADAGSSSSSGRAIWLDGWRQLQQLLPPQLLFLWSLPQNWDLMLLLLLLFQDMASTGGSWIVCIYG